MVCLEYSCSYGFENLTASDSKFLEFLRTSLISCWNKSFMYKDMLLPDNLIEGNGFSLLDEIFYLMQTFSEYSDR